MTAATLFVLSTLCVGSEGPSDLEIRTVAERALKLIESGTKTYPKHRTCFSCHHQAVPLLALVEGERRGIAVDGANLKAIQDLTSDDLESAIDDYKAGKGQPGGVTRSGYALLTLAAGGRPADDVTRAVASFLLGRDKGKKFWSANSGRPPSEGSSFTSTYVALIGLTKFGGHLPADEVAARMAGARAWLETAEPKDTEDRVFRLLGLKLAGGDAKIVQASAEGLLKAQRDDGGWAQLDRAASDAYAAGSVLTALHQAGGVATTDPAYRRGLAYLIKTQLADGSWRVVTRAKGFQPYFESGFPHAKDQFISMAGSAWAAHALALALPLREKAVVRPLPAEKGHDSFYKKYVDLGGLPILSSEKASDFALLEAAHLVDRMIGGRPDIHRQLVKNKLRFVVMAYSERTTQVPEQRDMTPKDFWDVRARGLGASRKTPVVSCGEENLLSFRGDPYKGENILIHEFAHAIHGLALVDLDPTFDDRLRAAHREATEKGLWKGTYAGSSPAEYWAEAVQSWFDCNLNPPDFQHNEIDTREELKKYDPKVAALAAEIFGDGPWRYRIPADRPDLATSRLAGFDPAKAPVFSWGPAQKKYDEVVAEKKKRRAEESAKQGAPR